MISVSMSIREGSATRSVRVRAATLERALELAGYGKDGHVVRVTNPAPAHEILAPESSSETPEPRERLEGREYTPVLAA